MPALLGIPALISFISSIVGSVIAYIVQSLSKRIIKSGLLISAFLGLVIALITGCLSLLSDAISTLPTEITEPMSLIIPDNAHICLSAIISLKVSVFIFDIKNRIITLLAS